LQINIASFEEYRYCDNVHDADIVAICLNFDELYPNISNEVSSGRVTYEEVESDCIHKCENLFTYIKSNCKAHILWFGFDDYDHIQNKNYGTLLVYDGLVDQINLSLGDMLNDDTFVDFKRLIAKVGTDKAYDIKSKYRWNAPYSKELISVIANEIYKQYLIITGNTKKCLVLDCDNVLWGGVLSEDGIAGIQIGSSGLGRQFQGFQRYLMDLYYHGIILAVSSKNDEADVLRVFREHTGMLLNEDCIACFSCNWENKPDNIRNISKILNIGIDSIVFVDDSIFEIESVKAMLPEVTTVLYKRDTIYDELSCFNLKRNIDLQVVRERTDTYKTNILRSELHKISSTYEDYISSLEMIVDIHKTANYELARVSELTQRTNKCTNGIRYTLEALKQINEDMHYGLYTVCLSDKFSNLGIVGVIGLYGKRVDLFSLSCRALGRDLEKQMICWIMDKKITSIRFVSTGKNEHLRHLLDSSGVTVQSN
jgi:FkbH-like protein